ncbi:hypothetical protein AK812_SmicGene10430 [Symbiodinium microadriaticum]|uniref:Uncharacterized protein n=1 Tax=Symbiodinium microadriaticum TaxID=2951 RepID=A0A1Q9EFY5_SYMMI|nr:hypothetical protein AK812_SmicGene10430 [Symbiodinium microadriaticum]
MQSWLRPFGSQAHHLRHCRTSFATPTTARFGMPLRSILRSGSAGSDTLDTDDRPLVTPTRSEGSRRSVVFDFAPDQCQEDGRNARKAFGSSAGPIIGCVRSPGTSTASLTFQQSSLWQKRKGTVTP